MPTPYKLALARIKQATAEGAATLDLSGLGLETLPSEIGRLAAGNRPVKWR